MYGNTNGRFARLAIAVYQYPGESNWQSTGQIAASQGFVSLRIELQSWQNC